MKKRICLMLAASMLLCMLSGCGKEDVSGANAEGEGGSSRETVVTEVTEPPTTKSLSYKIKDGEVTITGYYGSERDIRIPEMIEERPVTAIGVAAFRGYDMVSVYIPDSVKEIGKSAFLECKCLTDVRLPEVLDHLGDSSFEECTSLREIKLPKTIYSFGESVFFGCSSLIKIQFPDGISEIPASVCYGCTSLETVMIPETVVEIHSNAFYECRSLREITLPDGLREIRDRAFSCTGLQSVELPEGMGTLGAHVFAECTNLKELVIPKNCELRIGRYDSGEMKIFWSPVDGETVLVVSDGSIALAQLEEAARANNREYIDDAVYEVR